MSSQSSEPRSSASNRPSMIVNVSRNEERPIPIVDAKQKKIISQGTPTRGMEPDCDYQPAIISVAGIVSMSIPKLSRTSGASTNFTDVYIHCQDRRLYVYKNAKHYMKNREPLYEYDLTSVVCTPYRDGRNNLYYLDITFPDSHRLSIRYKCLNLEKVYYFILQRPDPHRPDPETDGSSTQRTVITTSPKPIEPNIDVWQTRKALVITWCQELLRCSGITVTNFSNDWMDGRAIHALVRALRPDIEIFACGQDVGGTIQNALEVASGAFDLQNNAYMITHFQEGHNDPIFFFLLELFRAVQKQQKESEMKEILTWCQTLISGYNNIFVENFGSSWRDGRTLMAFMHALLPEFIDSDRMPTDDVIDELIGIAVEAFDLKPRTLFCYHFKEGNEESIFGFVQQIHNHLRAEGKLEKIQPRTAVAAEPAMEQDANQVTELEKPVLLWCQKQTDDYENVNIVNFTSCWKDGLALNALIHSLRPEFIAKDDLVKQESRERITDALELMSQVFGIETTIEPYQMENGNKEAIYPLVCSFYKHYTRIYGEPRPVSQEVEGLKLNRENGLDPQVEGCQENKPSEGIIDEVDKVEQHCGKATRKNISKDEEDELTMALIRTCHRCKIYFCKDGGCNNMQCICGATQCYICRQPNVEYNHFCSHELDPHTQNCQEDCGRKCLLNFDQDEFDESEKNKVKAKSRKSSNDKNQYTPM